MIVAQHHTEWLSLVEASGPFVSLRTLLRAFPQGLDVQEPEDRARFSCGYEEWLDEQGKRKADPEIQQAWVRFVLEDMLGFEPEDIVAGHSVGTPLVLAVPEYGEALEPTLVIVDPRDRGRTRVLIEVVPPCQNLDTPLAHRRWKASPATRMMSLLHGTGVKLGLVTNGEQWMLVYADPGYPTTFASFYASAFADEPLLARAFCSLLSPTRLFGAPEEETLEGLFQQSLDQQQEVTHQIGVQVRQALCVLVETFDRIDLDVGGKLLAGVPDNQVYESAVTVMMRLVFLLAAEERGMLMLGETLYDQHYAISTLYEQLQEIADLHGEEVLERRCDAWSRFLALTRLVHAGVRHDALALPAYGGTLFDPDRYPFLEGRAPDTTWRETPALFLAIDNRTMLHVLRALLMLQRPIRGQSPNEAQRISFRAIDVEQVGHVYEGLLDSRVARAKTAALGLEASGGRQPNVDLKDLERLAADGRARLVAFLKNLTGRTTRSIEKALDTKPEAWKERLAQACDNDQALENRVAPFLGLLRLNSRGNPVVVGSGRRYVTEGISRRSSGAHYTPRTLTEVVVRSVLEPLVYRGSATSEDRGTWVLRSPSEILALRVCDPAMGSGAFLVQACRYLADRLVESWEAYALHSASDLPSDPAERVMIARRRVAMQCLVGIDKNRMAVEVAKLSMWLLTVQKDRPFTFLDHALRHGDSLLGIVDRAAVASVHLDPKRGRDLFQSPKWCKPALDRARSLRRQLESFSVLTYEDARRKAELLREANEVTKDLWLVADVVLGAALTHPKAPAELDRTYQQVAADVKVMFDAAAEQEQRDRSRERLRVWACQWLGAEAPEGPHPCLHWVLAFPELFGNGSQGFDAIVGNPPWVAYAGRAAQPMARPLKNFFRIWYRAFRGYPSLHGLFVERCGRLAPKGRIGLILPSPLADLDGYRSARKALTATHRVEEPMVEFGQDAFVGVTQPCFALVATADEKAQASESPWALQERQRSDADAQVVAVPQVVTLLLKAPSLPDALFREMGFQTAKNVKRDLIVRGHGPDDIHSYPLLEGKDVKEFWQGPPRLFLEPNEEKLRAARCRLRGASEFKQVKLVVRQTASYPIASLHGGLPFRNSLLAGFEVDGFPPALIVGLLNSTLYRALHVAAQRDVRQAAFPQVKVKHLRALPCPADEPEIRARIVSIVHEASRDGMSVSLRAALDEAVFDLFAVPSDHRLSVRGFLASRVPVLFPEDEPTADEPNSSLDAVSEVVARLAKQQSPATKRPTRQTRARSKSEPPK